MQSLNQVMSATKKISSELIIGINVNSSLQNCCVSKQSSTAEETIMRSQKFKNKVPKDLEDTLIINLSPPDIGCHCLLPGRNSAKSANLHLWSDQGRISTEEMMLL